MPQLPAPFCIDCGIHHAPDRRHRLVRAWLGRQRAGRRTRKR